MRPLEFITPSVMELNSVHQVRIIITLGSCLPLTLNSMVIVLVPFVVLGKNWGIKHSWVNPCPQHRGDSLWLAVNWVAASRQRLFRKANDWSRFTGPVSMRWNGFAKNTENYMLFGPCVFSLCLPDYFLYLRSCRFGSTVSLCLSM